MAGCWSALYFLNLKGDVLIQRTYRDDVEYEALKILFDPKAKQRRRGSDQSALLRPTSQNLWLLLLLPARLVCQSVGCNFCLINSSTFAVFDCSDSLVPSAAGEILRLCSERIY